MRNIKANLGYTDFFNILSIISALSYGNLNRVNATFKSFNASSEIGNSSDACSTYNNKDSKCTR